MRLEVNYGAAQDANRVAALFLDDAFVNDVPVPNCPDVLSSTFQPEFHLAVGLSSSSQQVTSALYDDVLYELNPL